MITAIGTGLLAVLGLVLVVGTLLPLLKLDDWWVRIFDFPRLQITIGLAAVGLGLLLVAGTGHPAILLLLAAMAGCFVHQGVRMFPYTPLAAKQVQDSEQSEGPNCISLLCANVLMTNRRATDLLALIRACDPDVIVTAECDRWWQDALADLEQTHPHTVLQAQDNTYGLLLHSRLPLRDACVKFLVEDDIPSIHAKVVLPGGQLVELRCLHPRPPAPGESSRATERDAELLIVGKEVRTLTLPTIVMGDLNDVAWSRTNDLFCVTSRLLDPRRGRGFYPTFNAKWPLVRFPLDHFFHSRHFRLMEFRRLPYWGSDHFPVCIRVSCEPDAAVEQHADAPEPGDREEVREKIAKVAPESA